MARATTPDGDGSTEWADELPTGYSIERLPDKQSGDRLDLKHENEAETVRTHRVWCKLGGFVREVNVEWMFNFISEEWEIVHRHTRDYDLMDDGETLAGDGSNWRGTGRNWREWAKERHERLIELRFP